MNPKEREEYLKQVRNRFVRIHGQSKWYKFCKYSTKLLLGPRVVAKIMRISVSAVQYWDKKVR